MIRTTAQRQLNPHLFSRLEALLFLLVAPPILTEIASGNTPLHALLNPRVACFLILAYSFPLLVIRESSLRWRLSPAGIFLLGLAYGIVNEGLLAQTLVRSEHVPVDALDHYIYVAGFNLSWACVIIPWHAFFAVLFPLVLLAFWFPSCAQDPWLGKRAFRLLAAVLSALLAFAALARAPHPQMLVCLLAIAALTSGSFAFRIRAPLRAAQSPRPTTSFLFGLLSYPVFVLGSIGLAARRIPVPGFFLFVFAVLFGLAKISQRKGFLLAGPAPYMAFGAYFSVSLFHLLAGIRHHSAEDILTGIILTMAFLLFVSQRPRTARLCPDRRPALHLEKDTDGWRRYSQRGESPNNPARLPGADDRRRGPR